MGTGPMTYLTHVDGELSCVMASKCFWRRYNIEYWMGKNKMNETTVIGIISVRPMFIRRN